ncbi:hypothetical protein [Bradyrhizobium sp. CCBAU 45394]|uniref:hypothetical protein n=1 Tax=Bradyrhizobium sp. CCBAU 45394 TaxID=1325087 RepID=UPI0023043EB8|nr:hypothetical protein [Bradyrhizobium sp. CCBAU 45394]
MPMIIIMITGMTTIMVTTGIITTTTVMTMTTIITTITPTATPGCSTAAPIRPARRSPA